jgi:hypothetical protein
MLLRYLLITALRDKLFATILAGLGAIWLLATFAGGTSIVEEGKAATAFAGFAARLLVVVGMVLFVALHVRRIVDSRELYLLLSKPVARPAFVVTYWASFALVAAVLSAAAGLAVAAAGLGAADPAGTLAWTGTLMLEAALMTAFALFVALGLETPVGSALTALGFYVLARMLGVLLAITRSDLRAEGDVNAWIDGAVTVAASVLPRLDLMAAGDWLVHGLADGATVALVAAQAGVYTALLVAAAVFDFGRRAF